MAFLICNDDLDGALNMALDEVLWHEAQTGSQYVRLYSWIDRPVLSLGYFQDSHEVRSNPSVQGLPYVRRLTGGGAIVHDHEITYSLALPGDAAPATNELYERVHTAVAATLRDMGIPAMVGDESAGPARVAHLCFARTDPYAVRVQGVKVMGSAQRRSPDRVLMHGSLLLARSDAAVEILGLGDLVPNVPDRRQFEMALKKAMESALEFHLEPIELPDDLRQRAVALAQIKYRSLEWNERRWSQPRERLSVKRGREPFSGR
jgi:lipoyl(octanoyl) transferase